MIVDFFFQFFYTDFSIICGELLMGYKNILLHNLKPGMQLAKDVYSESMQLLIPKGVILTEKLIDRLTFYSVREAPILSPEADTAPEPSFQSFKTHAQKVRESADFLQYNNSFYESKSKLQYTLTNIVERNEQIDVDTMFQATTDILQNASTSYQVFDMLHNMRHFDDSTYAHSLNVSIICNIMGNWMHLSEADTKVLTIAGLMHDIGKLLIPSAIITKPDKLTPEEFSVIQRHPKLGYDLLMKQDLDPRIAQVALCHHEKYDGSGYPMHLSGTRIPMFARIVCVVDIYEAMTADRVYRKGICPFEVIRQFEAEGFQKYDTEVLLTFLNGIINTYLHETVLLNNGEQGEIVRIHEQSLSQPMIYTGSRFIDLTNEPSLKIVQIL